MGYLTIDKSQLLAALDDINKAEAAGFAHCLAVFHTPCGKHLKQKGRGFNLASIRGSYSDLWERAHATDRRFDCGRFQKVSKHYVFNPVTQKLEKRRKT